MAEIHPELIRYVEELRKRAITNGSVVHKGHMWMDLTQVDDVALKHAMQIIQERWDKPFSETIIILELLSTFALEFLGEVELHKHGVGEEHKVANRYLDEIKKSMSEAEVERSRLVEIVFTTKWWFTTLYLQAKLIARSPDARRWSFINGK